MIKAKIIETGEIVDVRPVHHEIYDFMVCRNGGMMGEMYMRSELTIIGDNELDFVSLVDKMREAQKYRDMCSPEDYDNCSDADVYEFHVDEYLKKMENVDRRKALEVENTEFDYGHNVKHYNED